MNKYKLEYYVYILSSVSQPSRHYTGFTRDPERRLAAHNKGDSKSTAKYKPWHIETLVGFADEEKAKAFEIYLKSHSGRAFASKHF